VERTSRNQAEPDRGACTNESRIRPRGFRRESELPAKTQLIALIEAEAVPGRQVLSRAAQSCDKSDYPGFDGLEVLNKTGHSHRDFPTIQHCPWSGKSAERAHHSPQPSSSQGAVPARQRKLVVGEVQVGAPLYIGQQKAEIESSARGHTHRHKAHDVGITHPQQWPGWQAEKAARTPQGEENCVITKRMAEPTARIRQEVHLRCADSGFIAKSRTAERRISRPSIRKQPSTPLLPARSGQIEHRTSSTCTVMPVEVLADRAEKLAR